MSDHHDDRRPLDAATGVPIGPVRQPGYYPRFSTLDQQKFWDAATRAVVLDRVANVPPIRFFSDREAALLEAICNRILPQDDRASERRIPIVPQIDKRLFDDLSDGYRYEDMPPDRTAYRRALVAIDAIARDLHGRSFGDLGMHEQDELLQSLHDGKPLGDPGAWADLPVPRLWMLLVSDCCEAYYSHPWAWDEIGFGGPAYPRAYIRLERGEPEPWETNEERYDWRAPDGSLSDAFRPIADSLEQFGSPGQGGTH